VDRWRLRDGIGWEADEDNLAQVVGGIDLDATEASVSLRQVVVAFGYRWRVEAIGRALVSELETSAGRGGGWPKWMGRVRAGWDREFFSPRNRVGISTEFQAIGPRQDVVLAALTETELSSVWFADARLWLRVRDAELSFAVDNALDREIEETVGSFRRPRQWRWMLSWPFTN
jgi:hypothetical protein